MRTRLLLLSLTLLLFLPSVTAAQVTLYGDIDFRGNSESFDRDISDLRRSRIGNDTASSVRVDSGCTVELFADVDFRGASESFDRDISDLRRTSVGNDNVSSLRVRCDGGGGYGGGGSSYDPDRVTVYADRGFGGTSESFDRDVSDMRRTRVGNDNVSSVRVPDGCQVELFQDGDYRGESVVLFKDLEDLGRSRVGNDNVSSMRISCGGSGGGDYGSGSSYDGEVELFADVDFRGASEPFRGDVSDMRRTRVGNDNVSSLRVPNGCRVTLFADVDFRGNSETFDRDVPDLRRSRIGNDQASSMRVDCR